MILVRRLAWVLLSLATASAGAHEMSMAEMELRETSPGDFLWQWSATNDKRPSNEDVVPAWPEACSVDGTLLHCGAAGLSGVLSMQGVGKRYSAVLVRIYWLDGAPRVYTLTRSQPTVHLYGSAEDKRGRREIA